MVESSFPQNIVFMGERYATPSMDELTESVYGGINVRNPGWAHR